MSLGSTIRAVPDGQQHYDAVCKEILSCRQILANIMKGVLEEYRDCSISDIVDRYIEPESVSLSEPVYRNQAKILGSGNEDNTIMEGKIVYDVIFRAKYPGPSGQELGLRVNVEAQNDYKPGYPISSRAVFYCARALSAEPGSISGKLDYRKLEKVYSIWICMGREVPATKQFTASLYRMNKHDIIGEVNEDETHYNLMSAVIIRLGKEESADSPPLLRLLWTLFGGEMNAEERISRLEELGIQVDCELREEVNEMCNLSEGILERGIEKGATVERRKNAAAFYRSGVSLEVISGSMEVPVETVKRWIEEESCARL